MPWTSTTTARSFMFKVNDGLVDSNVARFSLMINPAPILLLERGATNEDTPKAIMLSCADVDGNTLTYTDVSNPHERHRAATSRLGASRTYTPGRPITTAPTASPTRSTTARWTATSPPSLPRINPYRRSHLLERERDRNEDTAEAITPSAARRRRQHAQPTTIVPIHNNGDDGDGPAPVAPIRRRRLQRLRQLHVQGQRRHGGQPRIHRQASTVTAVDDPPTITLEAMRLSRSTKVTPQLIPARTAMSTATPVTLSAYVGTATTTAMEPELVVRYV